MSDSTLRLYPLGGLGEIGMNCMAIEYDGHIVVVDCGVTFPSRHWGADIEHPDFSWLVARRDQVAGILITHGHEDHIGALPYLLPELPPVPIYGPPYALFHIRRRLDEHRLHVADERLRPTKPLQSFGLGPFEIEPVRVNHSIPDATALILRTPAGVVVHTGDFKIERHPTDGQAFDAERLREVGDEGVRLLLSDSTNIDVPGRAGEEQDVAESLLATIEGAQQRVVVATFASNVHRLRALVAAAKATGRKLCLAGRSLDNHAAAARSLGMLEGLDTVLVAPKAAAELPRDRVILVATGTQGESRAALSRIAKGDHRHLQLDAGDMVIMSARIIPGCEESVYEMINTLERMGVEVRTRRTDPGVHVSGHACHEEQREMLELLRPRAFMPVHGTHYHLRRHADLARECGVGHTLIAEDGAVVAVDDEGLRTEGSFVSGRVTRGRGRVLERGLLKQRALMGELGLAVVALPLDDEGELVGTPRVKTSGLFADESEPAACQILDEVERAVENALVNAGDTTSEELEDTARRAVKRSLGRSLGVKPLVSTMVVAVDGFE